MARQRPSAEGSLALTDWFDPSVWSEAAKTAKTATTILDVLMRMRERLARKKKTKRNLDQEVDELDANLTRVVNVLLEYFTTHTKHEEAWLGLLKTVASDDTKNLVKAHVTLLRTTAASTKGLQEAVMAHERRLKAIESRRPAKRTLTRTSRRRRK